MKLRLDKHQTHTTTNCSEELETGRLHVLYVHFVFKCGKYIALYFLRAASNCFSLEILKTTSK